MKVNVLGTEYTIIFDVPDKDLPEHSDGCMDQSIKTIKIAKFEWCVERYTIFGGSFNTKKREW